MALTLPNASDNLSNFSNGHLNFSIKTSYTGKILVGFMTGTTNGTTGNSSADTGSITVGNVYWTQN
jgi:hypothetical protein